MEAAHLISRVFIGLLDWEYRVVARGTSAILDMATVHHTDSVFEAARESGIRAHIGQAMMDRLNGSGLSMDTDDLLMESGRLADRWHAKGRLHYAYAPVLYPAAPRAC